MNYQQRKRRDAIRADYLAQSGASSFDPDAFVEWLRGQPDHESYPLFFDEGGNRIA